jgi:N-acetyl-anhydromuramyl-L-alanine amidase AmpD
MGAWVDGRSRGLWFPARKRMQDPRRIVLHWSGGNRDAAGVVDTLQKRGYAIHGVLEADGTFVQTADLDAHLPHAGDFSSTSLGIEMVNPGTGEATTPRRVIVESIHGRQVSYHDLTAAQYAALPGVLRRISKALGIPLRVKMSSTAIPEQLRDWRGVVGHYQLTENKNDPGPNVMRFVQRMEQSRSWLWGLSAVAAMGLGLYLYEARQ